MGNGTKNQSTIPAWVHGTAIVMGSSVAGLWAARALADHFERVLLVERDHLPDGPDFRPGAPQARQFHSLLLGGKQQMQTWFPGMEDELIAAGAVPFDATGDVRVRIRNRWLSLFSSGQQLLGCSRLLLEAVIRRKLREHPRVHFMEGMEVVGLQSDLEKRRITGVRVRARRLEKGIGDHETIYTGDLVVDALGRRSPTPEWLVELGYAAPQESEVNSFLGYVTRRYRSIPGTPWLLIGATAPDSPFAGLVLPEENDTMVVMMAGYNQAYPPTDPTGFLEFARHLGPEYYAVVQAAEPTSQAYGYRGTSSRWRHYELLDRWPERYIVVGDAFCGFNPIYGQGMTVAALSAAEMAVQVKHSGANLDGVAQRTLRQIGKITQGAWLLATSADLEWPGTVGGAQGNSPSDRFGRWYINHLLDSLDDDQVRIAFNEVNHLLKPVTTLFEPGIFLRVMKRIVLKTRPKSR